MMLSDLSTLLMRCFSLELRQSQQLRVHNYIAISQPIMLHHPDKLTTAGIGGLSPVLPTGDICGKDGKHIIMYGKSAGSA